MHTSLHPDIALLAIGRSHRVRVPARRRTDGRRTRRR